MLTMRCSRNRTWIQHSICRVWDILICRSLASIWHRSSQKLQTSRLWQDWTHTCTNRYQVRPLQATPIGGIGRRERGGCDAGKTETQSSKTVRVTIKIGFMGIAGTRFVLLSLTMVLDLAAAIAVDSGYWFGFRKQQGAIATC